MLNTRHIAENWLIRNADGLNRVDAILRCARHLATAYGLGTDEAERAALQALARIEGCNHGAWIDIDDSTADVVVVRRPGQPPLALTVTDLMRLHRQHSRLH